MNEKKLKNFLSNGFKTPVEEPAEEPQVEEEENAETPTEEQTEEEENEEQEEETEIEDDYAEETIREPSEYEEMLILKTEELDDTIRSLRNQVEFLQQTIKELSENPPLPDVSAYVTTREQMKTLTGIVEKVNTDAANKKLVSAMEQIATMREDFFKLCKGMGKKIDSMSAKDVLASFEAYEVDMENILTDGGVFIGHFDYQSLNTIHQRIVEVVPTGDPEKNGLIAERLSDGYKLGNRVLLKEKVSVYKYTEIMAQEPEDENGCESGEPSEETVSETDSQTTSDEKENTEKSDMEEKE